VSLNELPQREKSILIDSILPQTPISEPEKKRLSTFAALLWLSAQKQSQIDEYDLFKIAREPPKNVPNVLNSILDGWLEYIIRDLVAVAHEAVFESVMTEVDVASARRGSAALANSVVSAVLDPVDEHNQALRQLDLLASNESVRRITFQEVLDRVRNLCSTRAVIRNGLRRWRGGLSETDIYDQALDAGAGSVALLPVAWCLAMHRVTAGDDEQSAPRRVRAIGEIFQIGLEAVVLPKIQEFIRMKRTYLEVMAELTVRTVQQHLRVAWSRFAAPNGKDVSVLIADGQTWARNNVFAAGRTISRLQIAISWLDQLALIDYDGITAAGQRVLTRVLQTLERA
jgi:hypothetical protein